MVAPNRSRGEASEGGRGRSLQAGGRARFLEGAGPVDRLLLRTPTAFRRRLIAGAAIAVIVLAAISALLAWRQYRQSEHQAVNDLNGRVVVVGDLVDASFSGGISTLESIAAAPAVVEGDRPAMSHYFGRVQRGKDKFYTGIGWADLKGRVLAGSTPGGGTIDVSDRTYFQKVLATGQPYVSSGLVGRKGGHPAVVVAVPTFGSHGRPSGVLIGGIQLSTIGRGKEEQELGFQGLTVIDRKGQLLLDGLAHVRNIALLARMRRIGTGDIAGTAGLDGGRDHLLAFATSTLPGWTIAIDRPESELYAAPRRSLTLMLGSLGGAVGMILLILALVARRSRREIETQGEQVQLWSRLTSKLSDAATPAEIADALLASLEAGFSDAVVVVEVESEGGDEIRASSRLPGWRRVAGDDTRLRAVAGLTSSGPRTRSLEHEKSLRELYLAFGRRLKALHALPIVDRSGTSAGCISLMTARPRLEPGEWELLGAVVDQAARALARARAFEHEHDLAVRLQRSLLPDRLPRVPGVALAGEYLAGGTGVEVGGDWYDAVLRTDGILQLCVGDVSGRGVGAAVVMGRQRNIFHAHAYDLASPAEILRRMLRHVGDDEMITTVCVSVDLLAGEIVYSCAGHLPPLVLDCASGKVSRLDRASAPPLGVATVEDVIEATVPLPEPARIALYTDGLVERRGENIERGIGVLGTRLGGGAEVTSETVLTAITGTIGAPNDDVALLIASVEPLLLVELELPAEPGMLPGLRRRLRAWLDRRGFEQEESEEIVLAISEACNNAIEHAYGGVPGVVRLGIGLEGDLLRVEVSDLGRWHVSEPDDERGRGILLMRSLMHGVEIEPGARGTRVVLERRRGVPFEPGAVAVVPRV